VSETSTATIPASINARAEARAARELNPDQAVVMIGVGGLGHVGIQVLRAMTASPIIAIDVAEPALVLARELGADHTVEAGEGAVEAVLELTGGLGAGAVIDLVGEGDVPQQAFAMTATGGQYLVVGYGGTLSVPALDIMGTERRIVGNVGGTYQELRELLAMAAHGAVHLLTTDYPLERINEALADLAAGRVRGRAVVVP
jgi:NAD+-dependent secondary alcohol dehydrogenase Adh1